MIGGVGVSLSGILQTGIQIKTCEVEADVEHNRFSISMDGKRLDLDLMQVHRIISEAMNEYLRVLNNRRIL